MLLHTHTSLHHNVVSLTGKRPVPSDGAVAPWERKLEGLEEVEDTPADNHIIVEPHEATHLDGQRETDSQTDS